MYQMYRKAILVVFVIGLLASNSKAQEVGIILNGEMTNSSEFCVSIQLKTSTESLKIGTSSILMTYNSNALKYRSYTSSAFNGSDLCLSGQAKAWTEHSFDGISAPGYFNLNLNLEVTSYSCPSISEIPVELGLLCFDMVENNFDFAIGVDKRNSLFNNSFPNNGTAAHQIGIVKVENRLDAKDCFDK